MNHGGTVNKWRIILGLIVLVIGFLSPLATPFVLKLPVSEKLRTVIAGALVFGIPEILMIAAIGVMGKPAWEAIKKKLGRFVDHVLLPRDVSRFRYYLGVSLFALCLIEGTIELNSTFIQSYFEHSYVTFQWIMNGLFLVSFFIAGGDFWDKIKSLFVYRARVVMD